MFGLCSLRRPQFEIQLEQLRKDRKQAERRRLHQMIEFEKPRRSDKEVGLRQQQIEVKRKREEEKEEARLLEL